MTTKYRNGTYIAFAGCDTTDPIKSDIKYFNIIKAWKENNEINFNFINSHDKNSSVKDTSSIETLKTRLRERLTNSKNMLFIITEKTKLNFTDIMKYEIEIAIALGIPIILAYSPDIKRELLPPEIKNIINCSKLPVLEIKFVLGEITESINCFSIHKDYKNGTYYLPSRKQ